MGPDYLKESAQIPFLAKMSDVDYPIRHKIVYVQYAVAVIVTNIAINNERITDEDGTQFNVASESVCCWSASLGAAFPNCIREPTS
jgi:hypothetical protein